MDKIEELLTRGVANIIPGKEELVKVLGTGRKLNVYLGIDPTFPHIHLGHAVPLRKLQTFVELNHNVTFLIGDFTALIGDTSDKDSERPRLTARQIQKNFKTYKQQAKKILDFSKVKLRFNNEWLNKLTPQELIGLLQQFSLNDFNSRELIRKRLTGRERVGLHEAIYPAMQAYDSYWLDTDLQIGGTDQTFNMQAGRILQKNWRNKESFILTTEFLPGTDDRKMSKTWGNAIWLDETPTDLYAKVMAIKDELILQYFTLATNIPLDDIEKMKTKLKSGENPMKIKKILAGRIVTELHSKNAAKKAEVEFERTIQKHETPQDIPTHRYTGPGTESIVELLIKTGLVSSRSEAKRLIEQGGVEIDGSTINNQQSTININDGMIIQVGKRKFLKLVVSS